MKLTKKLIFLFAALTIASTLNAATLPALIVTGSGWGWALAAPVAGLMIGGFMIFMSISDGRKAKASVAWPSVPGVVAFSGMVRDTGGDSDSFTPVVTYSYTVNGQMLQSSRVRFSPVKSKKILALYPVGNRVQVFFDPQRPSTAVLEKGGSTTIGLIVGIVVIVASCGIGVLLGVLG